MLQLEKQVITYPSVHYRLLPILSHAYVFIRLGRAIVRLLFSVINLANDYILGTIISNSGRSPLCWRSDTSS